MHERKLLEENLDKDSIKDVQSVLDWCENNSTFCHLTEYEYLFWIPPFGEYEIALKSMYGDIPEVIKDVFIRSIHLRSNEKDTGYLLLTIM